MLVLIYFLLFVSCRVLCSRNNILKASADMLQKESERLSDAISKCNVKSLSEKYLNNIRLSGQEEKAVACHLKALQVSKENGWLWSSLGQIYLTIGGTKFKSMASNCFKQASKFNGKINKAIKEWYFLGPFVIGKGELDGDPVMFHENTAANSRFGKKKTFYSELLHKGETQWQVYSPKNLADFVEIKPNVNWNDLISSLGSTGILEWQGWVMSEFAVNDNNVNVLIQCLGVHTVYINDLPVTGDVYHRATLWFTIKLSKGIHKILIKLRAKGTGTFRCMLDAATSNYEILEPRILPDLWQGYLFSNYVALPIINYQSSKWLQVLKVSIKDQSEGAILSAKLMDNKHLSIAPGQIRTITVQIQTQGYNDLILEGSCLDVQVKLKITTSEGNDVFTIKLRCRKSSESFIFTFVDCDGSVQHGAAVKPIQQCENDLCPVLLTLHGTTVPAQNQADSYKQMVDNKYVFGVNKTWLVAPTRHGAHNWEGIGAITALTALKVFCDLVAAKAWIKLKASCDHVIFAGHSMGGHGALQLATHFPDQALALISLAGWIKKEDYGDSNLFFRHDISNSFVDPAVKHIMEACIVENDVDRFASNLKDVPVLVRIGEGDRTIHPFITRRLFRVLNEWGVNVTYSEIPNKQHWWWDTNEANDGGCVNDPFIRDFTDKYSKVTDTSLKPAHNLYAESNQGISEFTFHVFNPAFGGSFKGIQVIQQVIQFRLSIVKIHIEHHSVKLRVRNVKMFVIKQAVNRPIIWQDLSIEVNGQLLLKEWTKSVDLENSLCLFLKEGLWSKCEGQEGRGPGTLGPARSIAEAKFIIITGSQGSELENEIIQVLAVYLANLFYLTSEAYAPIIKDKLVSQELIDEHNVIILGSPFQNAATQSFLDFLPLSFTNDEILLDQNRFEEEDIGVLSLAPNGKDHLALLLFGTSIKGLQNIMNLASPTIPPMTRSPFSNMVPDYVITGAEISTKGPGGYLCAGFWDNDWTYNAVLSSC